MFDRRLILNFDWVYLALIMILGTIGIINLYSASYTLTGAGTPIYVKQMYWMGLGILIMTVTFLIDYRKYEQYAYFFYAFCILLLILVLFVGKTAGGSQRWLSFGVFRVQPSEPMKIAVILALAKYFHNDSVI